MGGSFKSFNESVLTLMTGGVSDGKLICFRETGSKCVCADVHMGVLGGILRVCLCV